MYVLIFSTILSATFLILRRIRRDTITICTDFHVNYPLLLQILMKLEFYRQIFER